MMKRHISRKYVRIFSFVLTAFLLTGCSDTTPENPEISNTKEMTVNESIPEPEKCSDPSHTFPETEPFIDDTGKPMQRDGDYLYSYCDGRLMRTNKSTGKTALLYETVFSHQLRFCLSENFIYFVERENYDSLDHRDTFLYRMDKDGKNLVLLQDNIINASSPSFHWSNEEHSGTIYDVDIYDGIIYLMGYSNLYLKLEHDGSVREITEESTLYGKLPEGYSSGSYFGIPSLPFAMRNYGYIFMENSEKILYRMNPVNNSIESLNIDINSIDDIAFSDNIIYLKNRDGKSSLFSLSDKSVIPSESLLIELGRCENIFTDKQGLFHCDILSKTDSVSGKEIPHFFVCHLLPDGSTETLYADCLPETTIAKPYSAESQPVYYNTGFLKNSASDSWEVMSTICFFGDYFYCFGKKGTERSLMRLPAQNHSDLTSLYNWSVSLTSSPVVIFTEEEKGETKIGKEALISYSMQKLFLEEQTDSDKMINQALAEIYADFNSRIDDAVQSAQEYDDRTEYSEYTYRPDDVLSFSIFCNYIDDNTISFDCFLSHLFMHETKGSRWHEYYVFDRHTGKRLTFEDFAGDSDDILNIVFPYVERLAKREISTEILLEPQRFSLSIDGYTLHFSRGELWEDRDEGFFSDHFYIIIPYKEFEKER